MLCAKFDVNWLSCTREEKKWKVYRQTERQTDDGRQTIRKFNCKILKKKKKDKQTKNKSGKKRRKKF